MTKGRADARQPRSRFTSGCTLSPRRHTTSIPQNPIRILHVVPALGTGGIESMLLGLHRGLVDLDIDIDVEVISHGSSPEPLEHEYENLGIRVVHVKPKRTNPIRNVLGICRRVVRGNWDIVHCHQGASSWVPLLAALIARVPVRISHAHGADPSPSAPARLGSAIARWCANYHWAASLESGKAAYGASWTVSEPRSFVLANGVDQDSFSFSETTRRSTRADLGIGDEFTLIQVARLAPEKNHSFTIDVASTLHAAGIRFKILLVGDGPLKKRLEGCVAERGLSEVVSFLGVRHDVAALMMASDALLLPSLHEGFGIVAVEAQFAGLQVLASDRVPRATAVSTHIEYLPIEGQGVWVEAIDRMSRMDGVDRAYGGDDQFSARRSVSDYLEKLQSMDEFKGRVRR